jgi:AcrR family transcriptional regulator
VPTRRAGRPRDTALDARIHQAVLDVISDLGYARLSYETVARKAGVSRPTLYLRAASKPILVTAALIYTYGLDPVPDTGTLRGDLDALQQHQVHFYNDPVIAASFPGLLADINEDPRAAKKWCDDFVTPRRSSTIRAVQRAKQRGELRDDTPHEWVCDVLTGPLISAAFLYGHRRIPSHIARDTVDLVIATYGNSHGQVTTQAE